MEVVTGEETAVLNINGDDSDESLPFVRSWFSFKESS
jgi:hypothetical protein